jgi:hypothetical protein
MRRRLWVAGLVLGLCGVRPAWAQSAPTWGPRLGPIRNQPIDTGAWSPGGTSPTQAGPFHALANLFPSFGGPHKGPHHKERKRKLRKQILPQMPPPTAS